MVLEISLAQIATAIDTDGTICIVITDTRYYRSDGSNGEPQYNFIVNIRQQERGIALLNMAKETLNVGTINPPYGSGMWTWRIGNHQEIIEALTKLRPYFYVKGPEADWMLEALDLWTNTPRERIRSRGRPSPPLWVKNRVREIADLMNIGQQKETSRRNKELRKKQERELVNV